MSNMKLKYNRTVINKLGVDEDYKKEEGLFFRKYIATVKSSLTPVQFEEFSKLGTDEDRVNFVYNLPKIWELDLPIFDYKKNVAKALEFKNEGNKLYGGSHFGKAAKLYWLGLVDCPTEEGELLSTLYANRSACLYNMQLFHDAISDIDVCLSYPYPEHLHHKVYERKARSYLAIDDLKKAVAAFKHALTNLDKASKLDVAARQKKEYDFSIMIELLSKSLKNQGEKEIKRKDSKLPPVPELGKEKNGNYPAASSVVAFTESETEGRYAVANENIDAGEVILVEKPHCATLLFEYTKTHCQHCFVRAVNPFPCPGCTTILFCSPKCRKIAFDTYHKYECSFLGALLTEGASIICCLALRLVTQKGFQFFLNNMENLKQKPAFGRTYDTNDFSNVYHLVKHDDRRTADDYFQRATMTIILLRLLQGTNFFEAPAQRELSTTEKLIGGIILHNLQMLQFNAHEIAELQYNNEHPGSIIHSKSKFIGGGIFPTLALFNHSCEPGIVRYFSGSKIIVRTVKPINAGEIIAENYGPIYTEVDRDSRRQELSTRYWFDCKCQPCTENWPLFENMKMDVLPFKCNKTEFCKGHVKVETNTDEFMFKCPKCKEMVCIFAGLRSLQDTEDLFNLGERLLKDKQYQEALKIFLKLMKILDTNLKSPYKDFVICQQKIRSCMLTFGYTWQDKYIS